MFAKFSSTVRVHLSLWVSSRWINANAVSAQKSYPMNEVDSRKKCSFFSQPKYTPGMFIPLFAAPYRHIHITLKQEDKNFHRQFLQLRFNQYLNKYPYTAHVLYFWKQRKGKPILKTQCECCVILLARTQKNNNNQKTAMTKAATSCGREPLCCINICSTAPDLITALSRADAATLKLHPPMVLLA